MLRSLGIALAAVIVLAPSGAAAQSVADFYRGKTVSVILGYPGGGSNGIYARAFARHAGKHIPGNPTVIMRSMPGAGSLVAANHLFNVAPKDGTALGFISATIPLEELLGVGGAKFKSAEFNWIGRIAPGVNMTFVKDTSPVKSIQDVYQREVILGASGRSSTVFIYPAVLSNVIGAKFKIVMGYPGSAEAMLAMERGEVEGHSTSLEIVRALHPAWLSDKKVTVPGSVCAHAASGADGRSGLVGAWPQSAGTANPQDRGQCDGSRENDHGAAGNAGRPRAGLAAGVRCHHEGSRVRRGTDGEPG